MRLFNRLEDQFKTDNVYHITVTTKFSSLRRGHGPANTTKITEVLPIFTTPIFRQVRLYAEH